MCVVAYVSGHGFGHAAREIEILRHLPPDIPLIVKTTSAEWFWRAGMGRPFELLADSFDVGCIQRDSIEVDVPATYLAWQEKADQNQRRLVAETAFLKRVGARVVVADVPPFGLVAAREAGIPGICVANFTWADIYAGFLAEEPRFAPVVEELKQQYALASLCLDTDLALPLTCFPSVEKVGLVSRPGSSHRDALESQLPVGAWTKRLALIYLGNWGYPLPYMKLESFRDWHFVSLSAPPVPVDNWTVIDSARSMNHSDLTASVDLVISKPGYGIVAECLSTGTPILYPPRLQFAEYPALEAALAAWPGGLQISQSDFLEMNWQSYLDKVPPRATLPTLPAEGGPTAARRIADCYRRRAV